MTTRKIAYLTPLYFDDGSCVGGGERFPTNLARGVVEGSGGRFEVELISFAAEGGRRELSWGVTLRLLAAAGRPRNPLDVVSWQLPAAVADADLVHIHQAYCRCAEVGLLVAKQQRKPVCVTDHGGASSPLVHQLGALDMVDRVVAYSDFGASLYRTTAPLSVVKGGVDAGYFTPTPDHDPATRDRALFVGRLLPHKGVDRLIAAVPDDLYLTVCGRPYHAEYFEHLQRLAEGKTVDFITDASDDLTRKLYRKAWATVLPSTEVDCYGRSHEAPELMGLTLLESLACGTPAVASRVGAMPEFVAEGETGFVFDTPAELREILVRLRDDPALVERLGRNGREAVERDYDYRVAGARLAAIYDRLLDRPAGSGRAA